MEIFLSFDEILEEEKKKGRTVQLLPLATRQRLMNEHGGKVAWITDKNGKIVAISEEIRGGSLIRRLQPAGTSIVIEKEFSLSLLE